MLTLQFHTFDIQLRHPFGIALMTRTHTPAVMTSLGFASRSGQGEASLPPYLGETQASVCDFLSKINLKRYSDYFDFETILADIDTIAPNNTAAKASFDIALHNLWSNVEGRTLWQLWDIDTSTMPATSCTIGIDKPDIIRQKVAEAIDFNILKIKLGTDHDKQLIETIREVSDKPLYVDANQGWKDKEEALDFVFWLESQGVQLIEQPFLKTNLDDSAWLTARSPLPIFADESFQRLSDLERVSGAFHGVNIKLMKCTGLHEARKIIAAARQRQMKVMIGCMTETSCAIQAAAQIAPLCDYADLDGPWLISNNPFQDPILCDGRIVLV